jgi:hypothetical protein
MGCAWPRLTTAGSSTSASRQGLTLVHFSAQLEPCLTQQNTLHILNTPYHLLNTGYTTPTRTPYPIQSAQVEPKVDECKPLFKGPVEFRAVSKGPSDRQGLTLAHFSVQLEDLRNDIAHVRAQVEHVRDTSTGEFGLC